MIAADEVGSKLEFCRVGAWVPRVRSFVRWMHAAVSQSPIFLGRPIGGSRLVDAAH